jgi:hypothetical protein
MGRISAQSGFCFRLEMHPRKKIRDLKISGFEKLPKEVVGLQCKNSHLFDMSMVI